MCCFIVQLAAQDPVHFRFTTANGLPSNTVYRAIEDGEGFIWFATDAGVSRFDGRNFRNFDQADGLTDDDVVELFKDEQGRVWFLSMKSGPDLWENDQIRTSKNDGRLNDLPNSGGWISMVQETSDRFWLGSSSGLVHLLDMSGDGDATWDIGMGGMINMAMTSKGGPMAIGRNVIFDPLHPGVPEVRQLPESQSIHTSSGTPPYVSPLVIRNEGIVRLDLNNDTLIVPSAGIVDPAIHERCWQDPEGIIWMRRRDRGIQRLQQGPSGEWKSEHWFKDLFVNTVFTDATGGYWVCTREQGVIHVEAAMRRSRAFSSPHAVLSLVQASNGQVYAGTSSGSVLSIKENGLVEIWSSLNFNEQVGRIPKMVFRSDTLWLVTDEGLVIISLTEPLSHRSVKSRNWIKGDVYNIEPVKSITLGPTGEIFCGSGKLEKIGVSNGVRVRVQLPTDPSKLMNIHSLVQDRSKRLWFEQGALLCSWNGSEVSTYLRSDSMSSTNISGIEKWSADTIIVWRNEQGLEMILDGRILSTWPAVDQQSSIGKFHCLRVAKDRIWVSTDAGITRLRTHGGRFVEDPVSIPLVGFEPREIRDLLGIEDELYVATTTGIFKIPINGPMPPSVSPKVYWAGMNSGEEQLLPATHVKLEHSHPNIKFRLAAIALNNSLDLIFRYRVGEDQPWNSSVDGKVELASLAPGKHRLYAAASVGTGPWSEPLELLIEVTPAWYQSTWFKTSI